MTGARARRLAVVWLLACALGCTQKSPEKEPAAAPSDDAARDRDDRDEGEQQGESTVPTTCVDALETLTNQDWTAWPGLPECSLDEVRSRFSTLSDGSGRANIGTRPVATEFRTLEVEGLRKPIKVWYRDEQVVLLEIQYPDGDVGALVEALGEPGGKLRYYQRTVAYDDSALVYPDRGIAVLTNPDRSAIIRIYLFAPTTLEDYEAELHHPAQPARRLPRR